jgi:Family of unknown function (DUF5946)
MSEPPISSCPGCGLELPEYDGPTHLYLGASAACWNLYGQLLADEYGRFKLPPEHKLTVDAYAVQHPGDDQRRARQSVAAHLIRICLMLERGRDAGFATRLMSRATNGAFQFPWFAMPTPLGTLTVAEMLGSETLDEHKRRTRAWAGDLWLAYAEHQPLVRAWCDRLEAETL